MRLEKVLAYSGVASRRKSKEIILNGEIEVNGVVVLEPGYEVLKEDKVTYQGTVLEAETFVYYLMNKPKGIISTVSDEKGRKTVIDLLQKEDRDERVYPIGRLDFDTAGIILLTNDGALSYALTRPEFEVPKTYLVRVLGLISKDAIRRLREGVTLEDYQTKPATVFVKERNQSAKSSLVEITITEGKNHQIKDMFRSVGFPVKNLTRIKYDDLNLDGVARGTYRSLKIHEVKKLYAYVKKYSRK
ncbi:MAG: rRNA pseudouridine synthase [Acholeplasmataceae bacterium]|jgi:23S rRNA pseudouridine2605 synthase|nr:rRNA pseudouridine synthase [Acholeplasmataceae bacterium]MDY0316426.1 pseudouridine synthase [Acholeplasmatales bacterium]MDD2259557.1 pseudouridine synthase [Acholeplasmataceae bacterium]MDD4203896.1 pseudouridine synthase [Acholeplasmataceae bacterium]MDD4468711.1 pseudouridine synthase [Acholeplasmataceae bacterium]